MDTKLYIENKLYDIAYLGGENPLPIFSAEKQDLDIPTASSMSQEDTRRLGWDNGRMVLPYKMQDRYTREMKKRPLKTIVLENAYLKAEILPELGARLYSLYDKDEGRELLFKNPYIRFANLAIRNAWFAGGIEWNIGKLGHCFFTCSPVFVARINMDDNTPGIRIYEYERRKGLFWQVDLLLPEGSKNLFAHMKIQNTTGRDLPMYWWTNIAVIETKDTRVIAPAKEVIYMDPESQSDRQNDSDDTFYGEYGYGKAKLPYIPPLKGKDATYPSNYIFSSEIYYQCQEAVMPWVVAVESDGYGLVEASTKNFPVRKMFCSGMHQGGEHWKEFLSRKGEAYIEMQAGFGKTQQHSLPMKAGDVWEWTEMFGPIKMNPEDAYSKEWDEVVESTETSVHSVMKTKELDSLNKSFRQVAMEKPREIIHSGSGWGALEIERCRREGLSCRVPASLVFPEDSIGKDETPWLTLLCNGKLPERDTREIPSSWMVQREWMTMLEKSMGDRDNKAYRDDWYSLLHYGVMLFENGQKNAAREAWEESVKIKPSCWAFRNLAQLALRERGNNENKGKKNGNLAKARDYMKKAWDKAMEDGIFEHALAEEYLSLLNRSGMYRESLRVYETLPEEIKKVDRIRVIRARIAFEEDDFETLNEILKTEFACIREGETELTDLWFGMWEKRLGAEYGTGITEEIRSEVRVKYSPPENIDFRKISA